MKRGIRVFDYIFVLRPTLLFPVWTIFLAGYSAQMRFGRSFEYIEKTVLYKFDYLIGGLLLTLCMGAAFILNQLSDIHSDSYNNKLFLIANGDIKKSDALIETVVLAILPIGFAFFYNVSLGIALISSVLVTGILYSCRPFLFKDRPHAGFLCNGAGALVVFSTGWLVHGNFEIAMWLHALPFIFALWSLFFFTTLPDIDGDKKAGKITVGVKYGINICIGGALFFNILTIVTAYILKDYFIFIPAVMAFPFFVYATVNRTVENSVRTTKFGLLFVALVYCYLFPGFFILLLLVFFSCKWYYKKRFDIKYPSFETQ